MDFTQIAIFLVIAAIVGVIAKSLRQPPLVGYLFAGIILSLGGFIKDTPTLSSLAQIGVTLLLFLLGMEMNLKDIPTVGKSSIIIGLGQMIITSASGYLLAILMGFTPMASLYIAVALTFSSTIIVIKFLSEKRDLKSLYGKIAVGTLLFQDFIAMIILIILSGIKQGSSDPLAILTIFIKTIVLFIGAFLLSKKVMPILYEKVISSSNELLFIVSIAWALGVASFVSGAFGFTPEIGGFLAGLTLSNLPEHLQIASLTRPLRDFFLTIFFVYLGAKLTIVSNTLTVILEGVIFSLFVLIGKPIIVFIVKGLLGYRKRTSFLTGITMGQISEFSFIMLVMGESLGHVGKKEVGLVILVGVVTMTMSTYLIQGAEKIYSLLSSYLVIFERKKTKESVLISETKLTDHIILVGAGRTGLSLTRYFKKKNLTFIVVDFDPTVFNKLTADNIPIVFGDINDMDIIEASNIKYARLLVSTVPSFEDNLLILKNINLIKRQLPTILTAGDMKDGIRLYEAGASYVIVPEIAAGEHIRHILDVFGTQGERLKEVGKSHFERLIFT
ncbi:hypothetical protein A2955_04175 [Candidatus Woesebacteria bacterium RIFCSPLOWO2_01_FULL_37_19]|uniref:Uncharacterized protein n=2 Tax=Candidatus Woeseibacteriota TaxID=1752722 RepID=A0A1F8B0J5_9BACT|nr:MAG: hypothetical protein A2771_01200 [Candidatus Woesebacteria bacterium RIFCSPHIGHO2_01_FULL_38_26b]OGM57517.1 MAG: hypothetical protein A2955_04175 [Candidatus Woesebacteria bacterium RIFCSPLOWO2_01_FULL_37_19]